MSVENLLELTLVDGIKASTADGHEIRYRRVGLRETNVADERAAVRLAERVVNVGGIPKLLVSDEDYRFALTMRHIDWLEAGPGQRLAGALVDMDLFGRLTTHDLGLIERHVVLMTAAAAVRYGSLTQAQFESILAGTLEPQRAPQPVGQVDGVGGDAPGHEPGPALLADFAGEHPHRPNAGDGQAAQPAS